MLSLSQARLASPSAWLTLALLFLARTAEAQPSGWEWSVAYDHGETEFVSAMAMAPTSDHLYIGGAYDHWIASGQNGPFSLPNTAGIGGSVDGFLVKQDTEGNVV